MYVTLTIYYIHFCLHCQPPLNPAALDGAHTPINSLDIQPIFRTVTSSPECCTGIIFPFTVLCVHVHAR